jgi:glycerol-3-phosphate acyltransferase PlsY
MVATAGGVFRGVAVLVALAASAVWLVTFAITRYASVSSNLAAFSLPFWAYVFDYTTAGFVLSCVSAIAVFALHWNNLKRLRMGTENRFSPRVRRAAPQ